MSTTIITHVTDTVAFLTEAETSLPDLVVRDENDVLIALELPKTPTKRGAAGTLSVMAVDAKMLKTLKSMQTIKILSQGTNAADALSKMRVANRAIYDSIHDQSPQSDGQGGTYTPHELIGEIA